MDIHLSRHHGDNELSVFRDTHVSVISLQRWRYGNSVNGSRIELTLDEAKELAEALLSLTSPKP
jgi:hypothetical protein